jgi:anti-sigma regulatory factor (Ser/Thr protein kinase)
MRVTVPTAGRTVSRSAHGHTHDAMLFGSPDELVAVAVPFLTEGLAVGDAAVVATAPATAEVLCEALGGDPRVNVLPRSTVYNRRTATAITTYRRLAEQRGATPGSRVRVVGEIDYGRDERQWLEWQRYEAVVNEALVGWPLAGLCVFDTDRTPESVLESALVTHAHLVSADGRRPNPAFVPPADYLRSLPVPPEPLQETAPRFEMSAVCDFIALRHTVAAELATLDAPREQVDDFLLAVDEMTSNAVRHGGPPVGLRLWVGPDRVVCVIEDGGPGWDDPFAGYGPAHGDDLSLGGMGLWLARQLCDHVDIEHDEAGMRVRLTTRLG